MRKDIEVLIMALDELKCFIKILNQSSNACRWRRASVEGSRLLTAHIFIIA